MANEVERLAAQIVELQGRVGGLRGPQLAYSSIEDGAIPGYDKDGNLVIIVGKQWDGSNGVATFNGPPPPSPSGLSVTPMIGGVNLRWEGTFFQGALVPMDFARVEIHASTSIGFTPTFASTLRGTFETPRGGTQYIALPTVPHEFVLVTRSLSGRISAMTQLARVTATPLKVRDVDLDFNISDLGQGTRIFYGPDEPTVAGDNPRVGEFWVKQPENVSYRWTGEAWEEVRDQGITRALLDAKKAGEDASQAKSDALAALTAAKNSGITTYKQGTPPSAPIVDGSFWIDTSLGNALKRWNGSTWELVQDQKIVDAVNNAATAVAIADGKMRTFIQNETPAPTPPMGSGDVGDIWIVPNQGNQMRSWDGSQWVVRQFGNSAIFPNSLVAKDIVALGTVTASLLETDLVLSTRIIGGTLGGNRVELRAAGIFAYTVDPNVGFAVPTFSATSAGAYIRGQVEATTFKSVGSFANGVRYIEIGAAAGNEPNNDEIRFRTTNNSAASIRSPNVSPGRFRISTRDQNQFEGVYDFDPRLGLITPRVTIAQGPDGISSLNTTYIGVSGSKMRFHDSSNFNANDIQIGAVENQHGWVANDVVGLSFLASTAQINVRNGSNTGYASFRALNLYYTGELRNPNQMARGAAPARDPLALVREVDILNPGEPIRLEGPLRRGASVEQELPPEPTLDLPRELASPDGTGGSVVAVMDTLWKAVRALDAEVSALRASVPSTTTDQEGTT